MNFIRSTFGIRVPAVCFVSLGCLSGCDADPLTPQQEARLERVFTELSDAEAAGVVQNLRYGGVYDGAMSRTWNPELAEAINQVHFDLDDGEANFESEAGIAAFLSNLSSTGIRPRLASELSVDRPVFEQAEAPSQNAAVINGRCEVSGGSYRRNGEQLNVIFWARGREAGADVNWNGWPGGILPRISRFGSGDAAFPMPMDYEYDLPVTYIQMYQGNGWWVVDAVKSSNTIEFDFGDEAGEINLPSGDLYRTGVALEKCASG